MDGLRRGNGDRDVVLAGLPEQQHFHLDKNDFWSHNDTLVQIRKESQP